MGKRKAHRKALSVVTLFPLILGDHSKSKFSELGYYHNC